MLDSTRSVRLSSGQGEYLRHATYLPSRLREVAKAATPDRDSRRVVVRSEIADAFQSVLTERLAEVGFEVAYELTLEGEMLEGLIDVFESDPA